MDIIPYHNTNIEGINSKQYNFFIPICLGNKFFTKKNIPTSNVSDYIDWALN
jgi:hypothetical protein